MDRQGLSFTLTLVVVGVVLLMTALTVIVLGGANLGDFFGDTGERQLAQQVAQECSSLADQIDNNYCNYYVDTDSGSGPSDYCGDIRRSPTSNYETPAAQAGCDWMDAANGRNGMADTRAQESVEDLLVENDDGDRRPIVTVRGNEYDCLQENEMTALCPAN